MDPSGRARGSCRPPLGGNAVTVERSRLLCGPWLGAGPSFPLWSAAMAQRPTGRDVGGRSQPRRGRGRPRPVVRGRGVKVSHRAARSLTAGHPWVFRDSLLRPLEGKEAGDTIQVCDEDGHPLGWGLVEPEGAIAVRMVGRGPTLAWDDDELSRRVQAAVALREATLSPAVRGACRLVHGEGDGLPGLAVDRLGEFLLVYKYSRAAEAYLERLVPILAQALS